MMGSTSGGGGWCGGEGVSLLYYSWMFIHLHITLRAEAVTFSLSELACEQ